MTTALLAAALLTLGAPMPERRVVLADYVGFSLPALCLVDSSGGFDEKSFHEYSVKLEELGVNRIRFDLHWALIEPKRGEISKPMLEFLEACFNHFKEAKLRVICQIGGVPRHFSDPDSPFDTVGDNTVPTPEGREAFASRLAQLAEWRPEVECWQIGNEPNLSLYGLKSHRGAYEDLASLTVKAFADKGIKGKLASAGFGYYGDYVPSPSPQFKMESGSFLLDFCTRAPETVKALEAVCYHPYTHTPEGDKDEFFSRSRNLNVNLRRLGARQIWATEFGWSTYPAQSGVVVQPKITEKDQGEYLARRFASCLTLDFDRIYMFCLTDMGRGPVNEAYRPASGSERDDFYGVLTRDASPKPSFTALKDLWSTLGGSFSVIDPTGFLPTNGAQYGPLVRTEDGRTVWLARAPKATNVALASGSGARVKGLGGAWRAVDKAKDGKSVVGILPELTLVEWPAK